MRKYRFLIITCLSIWPLFSNNSFAEGQSVISPASTFKTSTFQGQVFLTKEPPSFSQQTWTTNLPIPEYEGMLGGDFSGDGSEDIIFWKSFPSRPWIGIASKDKSLELTQWADFPEDFRWAAAAAIDLDGNNCLDLGAPEVNGLDWLFMLSDCKGHFTPKRIQVFKQPAPADFGIGIKRQPGVCPLLIGCNKDYSNCQIADCSNYFSYSPGYKFYPYGKVSAADIRGEGEDRIVQQTHGPGKIFSMSSVWHAESKLGRIASETWAAFNPEHSWHLGKVADFNGDGLADILVKSKALLGWWIALSNGSTALELAVKGLPALSSTETEKSVIALDLNGNQSAELIKATPRSNKLDVYSFRHGTGLEGVSLFAEGNMVASTDSKGRFSFSFSQQKSEVFELSPEKKGYTFSPSTIRLNPQLSRNKPLNFVAIVVDIGDPNVPVGKAIELGPTKSGPYVCLGYNPLPGAQVSKWTIAVQECPPSYVLLSASPASSESRPAKERQVVGTCCRLPENDILTDEHVYEAESCPDDFISTGVKMDFACRECSQYLRCTKINTKRYQLSPPLPGIVFGVSVGLKNWKSRVDKKQIPLAIRHGLQRIGYNEWGNHACIGFPWGSILAAKAFGGCPEMKFKQLQYKGNADDPPIGTAVKMFPDCSSIDNIYDPRGGCYLAGNRQ